MDGTESFKQGDEQSATPDPGNVNIDADNATVSGDVNTGGDDEATTDDAGSDDNAEGDAPSEDA